jgi:DNA-binding transcriptional MerR regulator
VSKDDDKGGFLRSGQLARLSGVSADTLRHYERKGLLARPRRSRNGYREYPPSALDRVRLVQRALRVGFTLDELARILKVRDKGGAPCREVRSLAQRKLEEVEADLSHLTDLRNDLRGLLKEWDELLINKSHAGRAGLLDALAASDRAAGDGASRQARFQMNRRKKAKENSA